MKFKLFKNTFFIYSVFFFLLLPVVFLPFLKEGRSFVWNVDGISQHYPALIYYGKLLRGIFRGNGFPMVDFSVGMGYDTITTLHYYVLGDPVSLLAVFMTENNGVMVYTLLILLRFYLAGISFLAFCRYWGRKENGLKGSGAALGALIYVFSGYAFFSGVRHPYFLNPMIYLPLLLIGLEEVMRKRKPHLLIVMAFLCTVSNFYFLYLLTVMAVIYVVFRYLTVYHRDARNKVLGFVMAGLRTGGCYLLGILLGAAIFLPIIYAFLQNGRMEKGAELLTHYLHYSKGYYLKFLQGFFASGAGPNYWTYLSFPAVTGISAAIVLCRRKYRRLASVLVLVLLGLCIPAFGYFMNGFSYITNRWDFLVSFVVAAVFAFTYEELYQLERREGYLLGIGVLGYGILAFALPSRTVVKYAFFLLLFTVLAVLLLQSRRLGERRLLQHAAIYLLVIGMLGFDGYVFYDMNFKGYVEEFLSEKEVRAVEENGIAAMISGLEEEMQKDFFRVETYGDNVRNEALIHGFYDVSSYFSLTDGAVTKFYKDLELASQRSAYRVDHQDNRTILDALASVRYIVTKDKTAAPYGYELLKTEEYGGKTIYLLRNKFALPLGYTYHSYLTQEEYEKKSALEKQNALLSAVVLEEESSYGDSLKQDTMKGLTKLDYEMEIGEGIELEENILRVRQAGSVLKLNFEGEEKAETYVRLAGLGIPERAMQMQTFKVKGEKEITKRVNVRNLYHNSYFGKIDFLINTGYSKRKKAWITITFPNRETYEYHGIELYSLSMEHYKKQIKKLGKETLTNIRIRSNRVEGDAHLQEKGIMVFAIPYSKGWTARVDGEKTGLRRGNVLYTAMELPEGEHHIVLSYRTPYLSEGLLVSGISLVVFLGIVLYWRRKEKSHV